jgi:hypothetical protein
MNQQPHPESETTKERLLSGLLGDANYFRKLEMATPLVEASQKGDLYKIWIELQDEGMVEIDSIQVLGQSGPVPLFRDVFLSAKGRQVAKEGYLNHKNRIQQERQIDERRREELHQAQLTQARSSTTQARWAKFAGWVAAASFIFSGVTWWLNDRDVDRLSAVLASTDKRLSAVERQLDTLNSKQEKKQRKLLSPQ